jgi:hypothetical protein
MAMLPEIWRASRIDLRRNTAVAAGAIATIVCAALVGVFTVDDSRPAYDKAFYVLLTLQLLMVAGLSSVRAFAAFSGERLAGTWDLLRLTPQSSLTLTLGKFLGAFVLSGYAALWFVPWIAWTAHQSTSAQAFVGAMGWATGLCGVFLLTTTALLGSTIHKRGVRRPRINQLAGLLVVPLFIAVAMGLSDNMAPTIHYFGRKTPTLLFASGSCVAFGLWALAGAAWNVGHSLLEPSNGVRAPLFVAFLVAWTAGFYVGHPFVSAGDPDQVRAVVTTLIPAGAFGYLSSFFTSNDAEYWRLWLTEWEGKRRFDDAPLTLLTVPALLASAVVVVLSFGGKPASASTAFAVCLLLIRDLAILQGARFSRFRNPEALAMAVTAMVWLIPLLIASVARELTGTDAHWLVPVKEPVAAGFHAALAVAVAAWIFVQGSQGEEASAASPGTGRQDDRRRTV